MAQKENNSQADDNTKYKDGVNRNARLIVRNISYKATEEALKEHFTPYGNVEEVKLLRRPDGKLVGCGFVHFTHVPSANKALAATNKKPFMDRPINVAWALPKNKYEEKLQDNKSRNRLNSDGNSDEPQGKKVKQENEDTEEKKEKTRVNRNARLVVRNVSFKATEETLKQHFEPYGDILEVKLLKKPDGKLVGCAFVHFKNVPMAKKALLNTNMKPFLGRPISVDWAVAKNVYMQHMVNQQIEMEDKVKKEESDSDDDDGPPLNLSSEDVKQEIKSESEDEEGSVKDESDSENDESEASADDDDDDDDDDEEEDDDDEEEEDDDEDEDEEKDVDMDDDQSVTAERKRIKLNDAEDGCTVFITNLPFSVDNDQLKDFVEKTGPVKYALVCIDKMTEHSKGSGFVKFQNKEDADTFLSLSADQLRLEGQVLLVKPALKRENLQKGDKKQPKDNRNLYLVKEGVVVAGTKAAVGVSASDMSKRLALERSKTQMLKNLNRFVSRYRLVVSNLPANCDDARLRRICASAAGRSSSLTEARVMRDLRAPADKTGKHPSKGYGFVMFTKHEDALNCLRKLNNNPDIFDKNNRPIVSFSIEDRTALNARKKRLEKSIANNPLNKQNENNQNNHNNEGYNNRKRKANMPPDESYVKKAKFNKKPWNKNDNDKNTNDNNKNDANKGAKNRFNKNNRRFKAKSGNDANAGKFVKRNEEIGEYTGLTAKEGSQHKMRSFHKLKAQADVHRQTVKQEKKNSKRAWRLKMAAKERVKLPKQKINKNPNKKKRNKHANGRSVF